MFWLKSNITNNHWTLFVSLMKLQFFFPYDYLSNATEPGKNRQSSRIVVRCNKVTGPLIHVLVNKHAKSSCGQL